MRADRTPPGISRRYLLAGSAGLAASGLAGCGLFGGGKPAAPKRDPLEPVLTGTAALIDRYRATMAALPALTDRLTPLLTDHEAGRAALLSAMGRPTAHPSSTGTSASGSAAPVPADQPGALAALRAAEQAAQDQATAACLAASPDHAGLLGSIAACRATHVEVLA